MVWTPINHGDTCTKPRGAASAWKASPGGSNSFWPSSIPSRRRGDTEWSCRVVRFFFDPFFFFLMQAEIMNAANNPEVGSRTPLIFGGCGTWMWLWDAMSFLIVTWFKFPTSKSFLEIESTQKPPPPKRQTLGIWKMLNLLASCWGYQPGQHADPFWISSWAEAEAGAAGADGLMMGDGRMGELGTLDMLGSRNLKGWYSNTVFSFQTFVIMNVVGINAQVARRPQSQVQMYRTKLEIIWASLYGVWWHGTGNAMTWKWNGLVFWLMIGSDWSSAVQQGIDNLTVVSYHFSFYGKEAGAQRYVATIKSCCAQFDAVIGREFWEVVVMANIRTRWSLISFESSFDFVEIEPGSQSLRTTHFLLWRACYMHE